MTIESMFEKAARQKIRIPCEKGWLYVEDLYDLTLKELDKIYKILNTQLKTAKEDSLLDVKDTSTSKLELQVDLVKYVAGVKIAEDVARKETANKKRELELLMTALADKKVDAIKNMTEEEIRNKIVQLQG
jgi:F420-0:gamma-glutamyl ligase